mgnify:FL=1
MPERLTLAPGVEVPAPEDGSVLRYSGEAVQDVLDFFSLLCFAQNEWAGKPFELLPWEEEAVRQFYGIQVQDEDGLWVRYRRYLYDELPKKNGKTELAAGLGLYHLLYDGEERPRVGVLMTRSTVPEAIMSRMLGWASDTRATQRAGMPASLSALQVPLVARSSMPIS